MRWAPWYAVLILVAISAVYGQVGGHDFVNYDDPHYVTENPHVKAGLTRKSIVWAFTSATTGNWHPLTWMSHMLDIRMFGMNPRGHHWINVILHALATLLLFQFLGTATGAWGRSAFVAAVFALHPLHVESVAWVSERKDVLSACFWFLALNAYRWYAARPRAIPYGATLLAFALGLMCKPMVVTLPFVLLLLDVWPLGRLEGDAPVTRRFLRLVFEKVPFFALTIALSALTYVMQSRAESVRTLDQMGVGLRLANAVISYIAYMGKTVFPTHLAVYYPYPAGGIAVWKVAGALLLLVVLSGAALWAGRKRPYVPVGWFWYLGTLVPVIGVIQVGTQAMADRYMYIPMVGLLIPVAWGVVDLTKSWPLARRALPPVAVLACLVLAILARAQVSTWRNTFALFEHALAVTYNNATAHTNLGSAYLDAGDLDKAAEHSKVALQINANEVNARNNLGVVYLRRDDLARAVEEFSVAVRVNPNNPGPHYNLGLALKAMGRQDDALTHFAMAVRLKPDYADARFELGDALLTVGRSQEAADQYRRVVRLQPGRVNAWINLGNALASLGRYDDAITQFEQGLRLDPNHLEGRYYLARCYAYAGQPEAARRELTTVLAQRPEYPEALALLRQLDESGSEAAESPR